MLERGIRSHPPEPLHTVFTSRKLVSIIVGSEQLMGAAKSHLQKYHIAAGEGERMGREEERKKGRKGERRRGGGEEEEREQGKGRVPHKEVPVPHFLMEWQSSSLCS